MRRLRRTPEPSPLERPAGRRAWRPSSGGRGLSYARSAPPVVAIADRGSPRRDGSSAGDDVRHDLAPRHYLSPAIFESEAERVFLRQWTFVAHESQLPGPGDFIVDEIAGESVIVVRDGTGEVRAFFNVCRHRGYRFCEQPHGHASPLHLPVPPLELRARRPPAPHPRITRRRRGRLLGVGSHPGPPRGVARAALRRARRGCTSLRWAPHSTSTAPTCSRPGPSASRWPSARPTRCGRTGRSSSRTTSSATTAPASTRSCARRWRWTPCTPPPRAGRAPTSVARPR